MTPKLLIPLIIRAILQRRAARPPRNRPQRRCTTRDCRDDQEEWHHEFPQAFRAFFRANRIDIDAPENGRVIPAREHSAIHALGYNSAWSEAVNEDGITRAELMDFRDEMVLQYGLARYRRPRGRYPRK